jgi:crotonobetainyl-CoA:carnitine CoA-transferase CaiB-like acyl-CoA transferase
VRPLEGVRVVELGVVVAGPATGTLLADWGADVIKLEPPEGDPQRGNTNAVYFDLDNRGKRSVALDLKKLEGRAVAHTLVDTADVFVSNLRAGALARLGLDYETLAQRNPRLVYAAISGYGAHGEAAEKAGYDVGAFWSRSGMALALTPQGNEPPVPRPGMGDHVTSLATAAGITAALFARHTTGVGQQVLTSLLRTGAYVVSGDIATKANGTDPRAGLRRMMFNPLLGSYQAGDGRWFWLLGVQATRHWPGITRAIGRPELAEDPRFVGLDKLTRNRLEVLKILDEAFATKTLDEWAVLFAEHDIWWDPLLTYEQLLVDPVTLAAGVFRDVEGASRRTVATPVDFSTFAAGPAPTAPEAGQHTEEVLLELGYDWDAIGRLHAAGVLP